MPLLRYDIGDYVRLPNGKCMCGRESPSYLAVEGRMADHLVTPSGQRVIGMSQIFKCADGVNEAQIYQAAPDVIEVRLVTNSKYSLTQQEVLEREFRKRLGNEIVIKFIKVCHIARLPNGKFRSVISEVEAKTN